MFIKKLSKRGFALFLILLLTSITLLACSGEGTPGTEEGEESETYVLRWGNTSAYPSQPNVIMREFKDLLESRTDRVTVELYEASAFGGPNEMLQGLQNGTMQVVSFPAGFYATIAPDIAVLDIPFLFSDPDEANTILNMDTPALDAYLNGQGLEAVAWIYESGKDILLNKKVETVADLKGLNIRTYNSPVSQDEIKAFGAIPVMMSSADVSMGLQQGTIDGVHCGNTFSVPAKLYELSKYYLKAPGTQNPIPAMFSKDFLDSLPEDLRELVIDTVREVVMGSGYDYAVQYVEDCYAELEGASIQVIEPTEALLSEMEAATAGLAEKYTSSSENMKKIYEELIAARDANR